MIVTAIEGLKPTTRDRSQIAGKFTWDLSAIYPDWPSWEAGLERLRELGDTSQTAFASLIERVAAHRRGAQEPIVAVYEKARRKRFDSLVQELASAAVWPDDGPEPTFAELAAQQI